MTFKSTGDSALMNLRNQERRYVRSHKSLPLAHDFHSRRSSAALSGQRGAAPMTRWPALVLFNVHNQISWTFHRHAETANQGILDGASVM
jgi:hypothetical protein